MSITRVLRTLVASAGSHRQRTTQDISDRRLQPTLFKDEHPRSGLPLASLHRLRGVLTSSREVSRPLDCFGGSCCSSAGVFFRRVNLTTKPLTRMSFPKTSTLCFRSTPSLSVTVHAALLRGGRRGWLPHGRVNVPCFLQPARLPSERNPSRAVVRSPALPPAAPSSRRCSPTALASGYLLATYRSANRASAFWGATSPSNFCGELGSRTRPRTSGPSFACAKSLSLREEGRSDVYPRRGR